MGCWMVNDMGKSEVASIQFKWSILLCASTIVLCTFDALPRVGIDEISQFAAKRASYVLLINIKIIYFTPNIKVYLRMINQS